MPQAQQPPRPQPHNPQRPVGGAYIDANGQEIAITEQMIQQACRALEDSTQLAHRHG